MYMLLVTLVMLAGVYLTAAGGQAVWTVVHRSEQTNQPRAARTRRLVTGQRAARGGVMAPRDASSLADRWHDRT